MKLKIFSIFLLVITIGIFSPFSRFSTIQANQAEIPSSLTLLGAGAKWAAKVEGEEGLSALYVNWQDNLYFHPSSSKPTYTLRNPGDSISYILENYGFKVEFVGDIPDNLDPYSVIVITAYWSIEPRHEPVIRDYLSRGGGLVLISGTPTYFICFCKDLWTYKCGGTNLTAILDWFGASSYINTGGDAKVIINNPFGTSLKEGDIIKKGASFSSASVSELQPETEVIAEWENGYVFSFRYNNIGRVYYQADYEEHEKSISEMTVPELQTEIIDVKYKLISLIKQRIQLIIEEIKGLKMEITRLNSG